MKTKNIAFLTLLLLGTATVGTSEIKAANPDKPRVVVLTDSEVDDRCSMAHFLLYANDVDVAALITTNSCFHVKGFLDEHWIQDQIAHYAEVYPNLKVHDPNYPTPEELLAVVYLGDNDENHVGIEYNAWDIVPGMEPVIDPSTWEDTPGSDRIVELLLDDDPRAVHIQAWGGGNTAAKAFQKIKDQYPEQYEKAMKKVVMYNIWYQDAAGSYIEKYHPSVMMLLSHFFSGTWDYGSQVYTDSFVEKYLHNDHGALGPDYVQDFISEGDSPSFFYSLDNGLRSDEDPTYGGWGGLFYKVDGFENVYRDVSKGSYTQWTEYVLRDFETRLNWCVTPKYEDANHKPKVNIVTGLDMTVKSGEKVVITAETEDNDVPDLEYYWDARKELYEQGGLTKDKFMEYWDKIIPPYNTIWWQYYEAGTYKKHITLVRNGKDEVSFIAPEVTEPQTIHIIYEATDSGKPAITAFRRIIVNVIP